MELFFIQEYNAQGLSTIYVQINSHGIANEFNIMMSTHFYRAFTKAVEINIKEFHKNYYTDEKLIFFGSESLSKLEVSTNNLQLHKDYLKIFNQLKSSSNNLLEEVKDLYSKDGSKMTDYLTKYISAQVLKIELNKVDASNGSKQKKLKI